MMKKTLIIGMVATLAITSLTASVFASTNINPIDQQKIESILTQIETLQKNHPAQIAYDAALELQNKTTDMLTPKDWKIIDGFHTTATRQQEEFLQTKGVPNIPESILDAVNGDNPSEAAFEAYVAATDKQSEAIEKLSESDYNTYLEFRDQADKLQREYMMAHGVIFVAQSIEDGLNDLDAEVNKLWEQMPQSYFDNSIAEDDPSMEASMNI